MFELRMMALRKMAVLVLTLGRKNILSKRFYWYCWHRNKVEI